MKKYSAPCGVAKQKKDDLPKLCTKNLIPARHHAFYEALPVNTNQKDDTEKPSPKKKKKKMLLLDGHKTLLCSKHVHDILLC